MDNSEKLEKISFFSEEDNETIEFYVIDETTINQNRYILVSEEDSDESAAYIMKQIGEDGEEATFEFVEDDDEYAAILKVFSELLDEIDLI